jgi:hypothetical protein
VASPTFVLLKPRHSTTHGLHLISRGKKEFTFLTAKSLGDKNVSESSSIPVIASTKDSPFFSLKVKAQRCLKYVDCNYLEFRNQDGNVDSSNSMQIFYHDIRGQRSKTDELINSMQTDKINRHILCFCGHQMEEQDLLHLTLPGYILGSSFCRRSLQKGSCVLLLLLFVKTRISAKLIFHINVKKRIWKSVPLNKRLVI